MREFLFSVLLYSLVSLLFTEPGAAAPKGFHQGPYLALGGGLIQYNWDTNSRTGTQEGNRKEPLFNLQFGWHLTDFFAPELGIRYTTNENNGRREHVVLTHLDGVYHLLFDSLMRSEKWRFLPLVKMGIALELASLPGDPLASDKRLPFWAVGPSFGVGLHVGLREYFYFGIEFQESVFFKSNVSQDLTLGGASGRQLIYEGGVVTQWESWALVGVHY